METTQTARPVRAVLLVSGRCQIAYTNCRGGIVGLRSGCQPGLGALEFVMGEPFSSTG